MTPLEDTPCPIPATKAQQKLKKPYQKAKDKHCMTLLTLNSANNKRSNYMFKIASSITRSKTSKLTIKIIF